MNIEEIKAISGSVHEVFCKTSDDCHGSFSLDTEVGVTRLVEVSLLPPKPDEEVYTYSVCVWGTDDIGMELEFDYFLDAWDCFVKVISLPDVTQSALKKLGFSYA